MGGRSWSWIWIQLLLLLDFVYCSEDHLMKYGTAGQSVRWTQLAEEYNVKSVNMLLLS